MNLKTQDFSKEIIDVSYTLNEKTVIGFWKSKKNTDMKKELALLKKMRIVDDRIQLTISSGYI